MSFKKQNKFQIISEKKWIKMIIIKIDMKLSRMGTNKASGAEGSKLLRPRLRTNSRNVTNFDKYEGPPKNIIYDYLLS